MFILKNKLYTLIIKSLTRNDKCVNCFKVNIKIASRAGSVMNVQNHHDGGGRGGGKHFTATYDTAYDEDDVGYSSKF